jgi:hypothetical protein
MPGRDGTGPFGFYSGARAVNGRGLGLGMGYRCRRYQDAALSELTDRELLTAQKDQLEARLNTINKHLDRIKETDK